ncbi:MAG: hypothetical protein CMJ18_03260 [Phycisphaeraceae bacterium]|nr:hypothetical protein [Phycisphaeraceae bacterium]
MSVLSKIFVVLVSVLSVILVSVMVTFVANQENWKAQFDDMRSQMNVAEQSAVVASQERDAALANVAAQLAGALETENTLKDELRQKLSDIAQSQAEVSRLRLEIINLKASNAKLASSGEILARTTERQRDQLIDTRQELDKTKTNLIATVDLAERHSTKIEILEQELRFNQERLTELIDENTELIDAVQRAGLTPGKLATSAPRPSTIPIDGSITMVEKQADGAVYVQLDVGRNDGVEQNMKFLVHQDWQFLGTMVIDLVDHNTASGRMTLTEQRLVAAGDRVLSGSSQ